MKSPEFKEKLEKGPVLLMTVWPNGRASMGRNMILWFLYMEDYDQGDNRWIDLRFADRWSVRLVVAEVSRPAMLHLQAGSIQDVTRVLCRWTIVS